MKIGPISTFTGCFALSAFSIAVVAGLVAGLPATVALVRACIAALGCGPIGWIAASIGARILHADAVMQRDVDVARERPSNVRRGEEIAAG